MPLTKRGSPGTGHGDRAPTTGAYGLKVRTNTLAGSARQFDTVIIPRRELRTPLFQERPLVTTLFVPPTWVAAGANFLHNRTNGTR